MPPDLVTAVITAADGLLVLGLVVLGEHPELLHRVLREGVAAAGVLHEGAALEEVVLVRQAVDEDVDLAGVGAAAAELLARRVLVVGEADAGGEGREAEEVAVVLRQRLDLLRGDVGGDLGGLELGNVLAGHGDLLGDLGRPAELEVDGRGPGRSARAGLSLSGSLPAAATVTSYAPGCKVMA